jgi:hypothetical protein
MRPWALATIVALMVTRPALAQDTSLMSPGALVRARVAPSGRWRSGRLVAYGPDDLRFRRCLDCATTSIPLASVTALEIGVGREPRPLAIYTSIAAGLVAGAALGYAHAVREARGCGDGPCGLAVMIEPPVGAIAGLFVGTVVGTSLRFEQWRPVLVRRAAR